MLASSMPLSNALARNNSSLLIPVDRVLEGQPMIIASAIIVMEVEDRQPLHVINKFFSPIIAQMSVTGIVAET